jgi:hypothetical protein
MQGQVTLSASLQWIITHRVMIPNMGDDVVVNMGEFKGLQ